MRSELDLSVLIGVLRKNLAEMLAVIEGTASWLCDRTGTSSDLAAMSASGVVGFTVCPPSGAELTQEQIRDGLAAVLELGHPTALYQLPQVTRNEVSPESVAWLAARYPHFYLLRTRVEKIVSPWRMWISRCLPGARREGQYARWLKTGGGPYDGFLLSSANCMARELAAMMQRVGGWRPHGRSPSFRPDSGGRAGLFRHRA